MVYWRSGYSHPFRYKDHGIDRENNRFVRLGKATKASSTVSENNLVSKTLIDEFRLLFLQWIICCHVALSMVENQFFRALIHLINNTILEYLPESSTTVRKWISNEHQRQKEAMKEIIRQARSRISLSFDTWTSPFGKKHVISATAAQLLVVGWFGLSTSSRTGGTATRGDSLSARAENKVRITRFRVENVKARRICSQKSI